MNIKTISNNTKNNELINWAEWWEQGGEEDTADERINFISIEVEDNFELIKNEKK